MCLLGLSKFRSAMKSFYVHFKGEQLGVFAKFEFGVFDIHHQHQIQDKQINRSNRVSDVTLTSFQLIISIVNCIGHIWTSTPVRKTFHFFESLSNH
mmetsp:Transcript_6598/g.13578  ORF Transcript_6598/g.13578 Transcript_6598/m.13578 type:complete len:96 (-) Transcript_6598:557-844(-)